MHPDATDNLWLCESVYSMKDLKGLDLNEFISELTLWRDDGWTNIDWGDTMFFAKRQESVSERKNRKQREKDEARFAKKEKESEERKLYAKLKKKYGG